MDTRENAESGRGTQTQPDSAGGEGQRLCRNKDLLSNSREATGRRFQIIQ